MFGHGQIEGFTERYGMEFKQARLNESPNESLVARHQREIAPLLKKRYIFAGSANFTLYDFWNGYGHVDENVFAYSNRCDGERSLVLYNNKYDSTHGTIHISAAFMDKGSGQMRQRSLADGLGLPTSDAIIIRYRDTHGLEYLRRATDIHWHGLSFDLRGFQCVCLLDWRELRSTAEYPWDSLCDTLRGAGVSNLDQELTRLRLRPLHDTLRQAISTDNIQLLSTIAGTREPILRSAGSEKNKPPAALPKPDPQLDSLLEKSQAFLGKLIEVVPNDLRNSINPVIPAAAKVSQSSAPQPSAPSYADNVRELATAATYIPSLAQSISTDWPAEARRMLPGRKPGSQADQAWVPVLAWIVLRSLQPQGDMLSLFDRLELRAALADIFATFGIEGEARWRAAAQVRMLLSKPEAAVSVRSKSFWDDPDVRWLAGVNTASGITYIHREQFEELLAWLQLPALIKIAQQKSGQAKSIAELEAAFAATCEAAHAAGYQLDAYLTSAKPQSTAPATAQPVGASSK
jgi:hypothetical protein